MLERTAMLEKMPSSGIALGRSLAARLRGIGLIALMGFAWMLLCSLQHTFADCGVSWERPVSHFEAVDYQGYVSLVETLGTIDLGNDLHAPIYALFGSNTATASPYAG